MRHRSSELRKLQEANERVMRLYEKAKDRDELKTRFFASVSHELRTPLALILGPVEKHLSTPSALPDDLRRDLEVVDRNARTILRHVNDLLDVASLDAGGVRLDYTETDIAALLRMVADHFSILAGESDIQFAIEAPSTLLAQVDADKLRRILLNLLSNAFKFTPNGGRIRISLRQAGGRLVIEVGDSGPGVPEDKRDEVFVRFRQLDTGPRRRIAGTGLGLAIVKEFTALLRGDISIGSAPEGGALFVLNLPSLAPAGATVRAIDPEDTIDAGDIEHIVHELRRPRAAPAAGTAGANERGSLVLIVEDSRDMSTFIAESLRSDGFRVATAFDGREGYAKTLEQRPDLVLTDVMMPVMSGDEMVRSIRQHAELDSIPIIVLSGKADDAPRLRMLREGAQDYLDKPFVVDELRVRVRNLVARKRAEEAGSRLRQQIEDVTRASLSVSDATASLPEASVRAVLRTIALNAQTIAGAEFAAVGINDDPDSPLELWEYAGISDHQVSEIGGIPRPVGVLRLAPNGQRTVRLRDVRTHQEYRDFPPHHPVMTSFLATSIRCEGRTEGTLFLANKRDGGEFTEQDEALVEMVAERAGLAIETARLYSAEGRERVAAAASRLRHLVGDLTDASSLRARPEAPGDPDVGSLSRRVS